MIRQFHQFQYGEPHYSSNIDQLYAVDQAMIYTGGHLGSTAVNVGSVNTYNASDRLLNTQNDYWNATYGGYTTAAPTVKGDFAGVRNCSNFMWVFDNPNLYDHEFQESKRNVQSGDLLLEYTLVDLPLAGSATAHFFMLFSGNVESNIQDASVTALAANADNDS